MKCHRLRMRLRSRFAVFVGATFVLWLKPGQALAHLVQEVSVSLGEAFYNPASDLGETVILPQVGYGLGFELNPFGISIANPRPTRVTVTPHLQVELGRYNQAWMPEATAGMRAGYTLGWLRPELQIAMGYQSVRHRRFIGLEGETLHQERRWSEVAGVGLRLNWLECLSTGLSARWEGIPMWRLELGYRLGSLGPLLQRARQNRPL
jgi:hypothetical protein